MSEVPALRKAANAKFSGLESVFRPIRPVAEVYEQLMGGLWVGGWMELTDTELTFVPNGLNTLLHRGGDMVIRLPLESVRAADLGGGFVTKIMRIRTDDGTAWLRCWGARGFVTEISRRAGLSP